MVPAAEHNGALRDLRSQQALELPIFNVFAAEPESLPSTRVVWFEYHEVTNSIVSWRDTSANIEVAFRKEANFKGHRAVRSAFGVGSQAERFSAFAWDQPAARLYVDMNRNGDLTDDPAGVFACADKGPSRNKLYIRCAPIGLGRGAREGVYPQRYSTD